MNKSQICIIIPIYKEILNDFEIQSVEQCIKVLSDYTIHFVCPEVLNMNFYKTKFSEIENFVFFDEKYFKDVSGYNRLMLCADFYKTFKKFDFMLIYQTDCFVFRDELLAWAMKGFDYIGGVWFDNYHDNPYLGANIWHAGNGGLSLRKTAKMISLLSSKKPLKSLKQLILEKKQLKNTGTINLFKRLMLLPNWLLGYKNNLNYLATKYTLNEDVFYMEACLLYQVLKTPKVEDALGFSWDRNPAFLFDKLGYIPFACHAWFREDAHYKGNRKFWLNQISRNDLN